MIYYKKMIRYKGSAWGVFDNWKYHKILSVDKSELDWNVFNELFGLLDNYKKIRLEELRGLVCEWDLKMKEMGGDPSCMNWSNFRPLRLSREEDWSDWLIHLIETSKTGYLAKYIFEIPGLSEIEYVDPPLAERESAQQDCRADIVIRWKNEIISIIEVKTGDMNLDKTFHTVDLIKRKLRNTFKESHNFIVLLRNQLNEWEIVQRGKETQIKAVNWEKIAKGLRKSLVLANETLVWKAMAYVFLGAIEQKILKFPPYLKEEIKSQLSVIDSQIQLFKELNDE